MKKLPSVRIALLLPVLFVSCPFSGIYPFYDLDLVPLDTPIEAETLLVGSLETSIDARIELISVVQYLTERDPCVHPAQFPFPYAYKDAVEAWFGGYRNHPSVTEYLTFLEEEFDFNAPVEAVLYLDGTLDPVTADFPDSLLRRTGTRRPLYVLYQLLQSFARDTDFPGFFESQRPFYRTLLSQLSANLGNRDYRTEIAEYTGVDVAAEYRIILLPLYRGPCFGPSATIGGVRTDYTMLSQGYYEDEGAFRLLEGRELRRIIRHEFGHSVTRETFLANLSLVNRYASLMEPLRGVMWAYGNRWDNTLGEHIVAGLSTRLAYLDSPEDGAWARNYEYDAQHLIYIDAIVDGYAEFEAARAADPSVTLNNRLDEIIQELDRYM